MVILDQTYFMGTQIVQCMPLLPLFLGNKIQACHKDMPTIPIGVLAYTSSWVYIEIKTLARKVRTKFFLVPRLVASYNWRIANIHNKNFMAQQCQQK